jgi:pimeloyl-ACP methyl ester carboxylesterase
MKAADSTILTISGLRYHVRTWGRSDSPALFMLHGWMDVSASFQFLVDELKADWRVIAPDWRGFGLSEWAQHGYWFPDYIADLDALLEHFSPAQPALILGHSMGGNVANLYAGIRPQRVSRLILAEGFGMSPTRPEQAPDRYAQWLDENRAPPTLRPYASLEEVVARLQSNNPLMTQARAEFLATHWAEQKESGEFRLRADPLHKMVNPVLYRIEEAMACWRRIEAPVLWMWGNGEWMKKWIKGGHDTLDTYRACYRSLQEVTLPDAGHMMHLDNPEAMARVLEQFALHPEAQASLT